MNLDMVDLTQHAKMRRKQMRVTEHEIEATLTDPDTTYPGDPKYGDNRRAFQRGRLVVITDLDGTVITVLWHRKEGRDGQEQEG